MFTQADLAQTLQSIPWFLELKSYQIDRLVGIAGIRTVEGGEEILREGDREDYLYIVLEGRVTVETHVPTHGKIAVFTAEPLDIIGWSSLTPVVRQRTATARALAPCQLIALEGESLRRLCDEDHDLGYIIMRRIANVVASRLLTTRLQLLDLILHTGHDANA